MSDFNPKNILVTGGAGFIGCNYVRYMLATYTDMRIINLDALTYAGSLDNLKDLPDKVNGGAREGALGYASRHVFVQGDICDRGLVDKLMREYKIDTVVHFAAESHVDNSISEPEVFVKTNVMGTFTLLDSARQYWQAEKQWGKENCRFHHISTDEVYGTLSAEDPAFSETTPYAPNSPYSASKAGSDHLVRAYFHTYGLPVTTTNCSNNYGSYQHSEKFIPTVIRKCLQQESIPVYGDGSNIRDWLYVTDHCSGIDAVLRKGALGEVYNIGGINEWANIDICRLICQLMDEHKPENAPHEKLITFVQDRAGHDWRYAIDATKMNDELDWQPEETFETGIRKTVQWYLASMQSNMSS
ncbi:dTDP-glucose 4,6-dehydratase [Mariprofundus ferrooxydans]|nr:dTDP-glucose 4,6-dehydratase [Mariprofundus ferrooxydans]